MHVYRFKFTFEDSDDFMREVEVGSEQTFEEFHFALVENLGLNKAALSSFFIADSRFRKKREISLIDMQPEMLPEQTDPEEAIEPMLEMRNAVVSDFIDDPHQKLIWVYDYINYWTFYVELLKIAVARPDHDYPRISKAVGETPPEIIKKDIQANIAPTGFEFEPQEEGVDPEDLKSLDEDGDFFDEEGESFDDFA